ncbi:MAG: type VI secretion system Vgr family protein [Longimicrobiales bacterium]
MPSLTQVHRPFRFNVSGLGENDLLPVRFTGYEAVSKLFAYQLELISENKEIDPKSVLRQPASITVTLPGDSERLLHGVVNRFVQLGTRDDLTFYRADVVPWLWFLSLKRDCRIFQNKSVPDIIEAVFKADGYSDYKLQVTRNYAPREYCVQYRESNLNFVTRLMEEEGIFYYFAHDESKHTLMMGDTSTTLEGCPGAQVARVSEQPGLDEDIITSVMREDTVFSGKVTLRDYDPLQPALTLSGSMGDGREEVYDYQPVIYTKMDVGERYARNQLEAEEAFQRLILGDGTCRAFQAGFQFNLEEHYRSDVNGAYLLTEVRHRGMSQDYRAWETAGFEYTNDFVAIPFNIPYRPLRTAQKPVMRGSQTAVVVGKSGEEIWTDKHGRVKVQFHWDREGKKDENSSCWVRVSSGWAGKHWGMISIPRIGQEVIVDFIEGDIDRPIIVGRVYNAEQTPPYDLPTNQTQSGILSRSSKGGGTEDFNEIRFEDKKGEEDIYVHAQKDKHVVVENDRTETVGHDEMITIENNRTEEVKKNEKITIGENRTEEVKKDETIKVGGKRNEEVVGNEGVVVKGNRDHEVKGSEKVAVGASRSVSIKANDKLEVGANLDAEAKVNIKVKAGVKIELEANATIELKVGGSTLKMTPASIELKAPIIKIEGQGMLQMKAPMVMGQADAMMQIKGAMTMVNGDGVLMAKGGITMIG